MNRMPLAKWTLQIRGHTSLDVDTSVGSEMYGHYSLELENMCTTERLWTRKYLVSLSENALEC